MFPRELTFTAPAYVLVHFMATLAAGRRHRIVLVLRPGSDRPELWPVCSHTSNCQTCRRSLDVEVYVNLGTLQLGSEIEMKGIGIEEAPAPAASNGFPKGAGV